MSRSNDTTADVTVKDEEEFADKRVKKRILDSRDRVNEREDTLFNEPLLNPDVQISDAQATVAWGQTVKQFARDIEVLLRRMPSDTSSYYLHEVDLGTVTLVPPDRDGYQFSAVTGVVEEQYSASQFKQRLGLPPSAELPMPVDVPFKGLLSVIERDPVLVEEWSVCVDDSGAPPTHEYAYLQKGQEVPKWIYENAVRAADLFLHDVGIGVTPDPGEYRSEEPGL